MGGIRIEPLSPAGLPDYLRFFDRDAFADNPDWASCYCMFFHFDGTGEDWERATGDENRAAKARLIKAGTARGYLAYDGERPVGWVNAAPRRLLPKLDSFAPIDDADGVGDIVCFVVASDYRRQGVSSALLEEACRGFASDGLAIAEAFPPKHAEGDADQYRGPLSLYVGAGFAVHRELENHFLVRKRLVI
jgi:GNAT superfamily N-acetyltransferase